MKRMLVINLGWEQEPLLDLLGSLDLELYGAHASSDYYKGIRYRDVLIADPRDLPRLLQFAQKVRPEAVISDQCDYSQFAQAAIASRFGLPGPRVRDAQIGNSKLLQRRLGREAGLTCPDFSPCLDVEDVLRFGRERGYPIMVKPVDNRGSFGVNRADDENEARDAFYDALIHSHSRVVLAESYIQGRHLTVDGYVFRGRGPRALAVASKKMLAVKHSVISGEITYPGELRPDLYDKAAATLEQVATALGFQFGFLHGEFILTEAGEVYLTEIANRGGGTFTSEIMVPNVSGIDIKAVYTNDCLGTEMIPVDYDPDHPRRVPTVMKLFAFSDLQGGVVKEISGIDRLEAREDVLRLKMLIHKGDVVGGIDSGADRHGVIIMTAPDPADLKRRLADALSLLRVSVEEKAL